MSVWMYSSVWVRECRYKWGGRKGAAECTYVCAREPKGVRVGVH